MADQTSKPLEVKISILDPAREERRAWQAKRDGKDPNRMRAAVLLTCYFCKLPIGPDALIFSLHDQRACAPCYAKGGKGA